jgi:FXSXX-COOH protein
MNVVPTAAPAVAGVSDTRAVTLDQLAHAGRATAESLRRVIPIGETTQVAVAAFASSI